MSLTFFKNFFQPFKYVKSILNSLAIQKQAVGYSLPTLELRYRSDGTFGKYSLEVSTVDLAGWLNSTTYTLLETSVNDNLKQFYIVYFS